MELAQLAVFVRPPTEGLVKTRLESMFGAKHAADNRVRRRNRRPYGGREVQPEELADARPRMQLVGRRARRARLPGERPVDDPEVAAAMEGCVQGLPAAAMSLADWRPRDFGAAAAFLRRMLPEILANPLPRGTMWNINVPDGPESSLRGVRMG